MIDGFDVATFYRFAGFELARGATCKLRAASLNSSLVSQHIRVCPGEVGEAERPRRLSPPLPPLSGLPAALRGRRCGDGRVPFTGTSPAPASKLLRLGAALPTTAAASTTLRGPRSCDASKPPPPRRERPGFDLALAPPPRRRVPPPVPPSHADKPLRAGRAHDPVRGRVRSQTLSYFASYSRIFLINCK